MPLFEGAEDDRPAAGDDPAPDPTTDPTTDPDAEPPVSVSTAGAQAADQQGTPDQHGTPDPQGTAAPQEPDALLVGAVDTARAAAVVEGGDAVGEHLGIEADPGAGGEVLTHSFATRDAAYVGWRWAVTLARAEGADAVTVDEVVLLPGAGALLAPAWVPWSERIAPGDLSPGDLLPPAPDDPRLVPSYADVDAEPMPFDLHRELGLGRPRVLSREGRLEAAERWYDGEAGPGSPLAKAAPASCASCGFLAPLAGALGTVFGACANALAADDGRVVALTHGCGAHSETVLEAAPESSFAGMAVEHEELELVAPDVDAAPADANVGETTVTDA